MQIDNKIIINLAPTGSVTDKGMTPHVPQSPEEIVTDVLRCAELGVSMVHIHAREQDGSTAFNKEVFGRIISGIRATRNDLVIVVSTTGRQLPEIEKRCEVLNLEGDLKPDMASLTLGSLNFYRDVGINGPEIIFRLAEVMKDKGIKPELEVFDLGMVNTAHVLIKKGLIQPPYYFNIILGNIASAQAKLSHLALIVSELPENSYWSVGGIGSAQKRMNALGIIEGNGVRVGLEDNIWLDDSKRILATNYSLVERIVNMAAIYGREIANPSYVRKILDVKGKRKLAFNKLRPSGKRKTVHAEPVEASRHFQNRFWNDK